MSVAKKRVAQFERQISHRTCGALSGVIRRSTSNQTQNKQNLSCESVGRPTHPLVRATNAKYPSREYNK